MLKNKDVIEKLTREQKLSFLAAKSVEGLPVLSLREMPLGGSAMASTWNCELLRAVSYKLALSAKKDNINALIAPETGIKTNPYSGGVCEDTQLAAKLGAAYAIGAAKAGITPVLRTCAITESHAQHMDIAANKSLIRAFFARPFSNALIEGGGGAVMSCCQQLSGNYGDSNIDIINSFLQEKSFGGPAVICNEAEPLNDETLDLLTDKLLTFVSACGKRAKAATAYEAAVTGVSADGEPGLDQLLDRAAEESVVLLKNSEQALPLVAGTKMCVIGRAPAGFTESLSAKQDLSIIYTGYAEGYNPGEQRSDALIEPAVSLALSSDVVLLFLSRDGQGLKLPVNQAALLGALEKTQRNIIAVIDGGIDAGFDGPCAAVLLAPPDIDCNAALIKILTGLTNPSGRLTYTIYDNPDEGFAELKKRKESGRIKIGPFLGYRGYDINGLKVKYSFGHGLSYTSFSYSSVKANGHTVSFRVKNTGKRAGCETVQIYIAKKDSNIIRPVKELKGFVKVYLEAGKTKTLQMECNYSDFSVFDEATGKWSVESGKYNVYLGASSTDIRAETTFNLAGYKLPASKEALAQYSSSLSNIVSGGYTLDTPQQQVQMQRENEIIINEEIALKKLFDTEFAQKPAAKEKPKETVQEDVIIINTQSFLEDGMTVKSALNGLVSFMKEHGVVLRAAEAREMLSALSVGIQPVDEKARRAPVMVCPEQFLRLCDVSEKTHCLDEKLWKKVDKLEAHASSSAPYRISNKTWRKLERYTSVYLECGGTGEEALKAGVNTLLLPEILPLVGGDREFSLAVQRILGE